MCFGFHFFVAFPLFTLLFSAPAAPDSLWSRRPNRTNTAAGFLAFPVYAHIPGIGSTYGLGVLWQNLGQTRTNVVALASGGDTAAAFVGIEEVHLWLDHIVFGWDAFASDIPYQDFARGIKSDPDLFIYEDQREHGTTASLSLRFAQSRVRIEGAYAVSQLQYDSVESSDGLRLQNRDHRFVPTVGSNLDVILDFTDDIVDPRRGLNLQFSRNTNLIFDQRHSEGYTLNAMATLYVPIHHASTWVFNAFRGEAFVVKQNQLSAGDLQSAAGLDCTNPSGAGVCASANQLRLDNRARENQVGIASPLGGPNQLRGYELNRFAGSRSLFYATELRLNLLSEPHQLDLGFFRGDISVVQVAPFFEIGAVSDRPQPVETAGYQSSYGAGLRVGFSGAIARVDFGFSPEGSQVTVFVGYPFGLAPF